MFYDFLVFLINSAPFYCSRLANVLQPKASTIGIFRLYCLVPEIKVITLFSHTRVWVYFGKIFLTQENTILLLISLAQHRDPPRPLLGQGFETINLLANIIRD